MVGVHVGRPLFEERPSEEQWKDFVERYGSPRVYHFSWDLRGYDEGYDDPGCMGEVVLLITNRHGHIAYVRRKGDEGWSLPMGRIMQGESIEEAAVREAWEETGTTVRIRDSPAMYMTMYSFARWSLMRWSIVFRASTEMDMSPHGCDGIAEARFFKERPRNPDPNRSRWMDQVLALSLIDPPGSRAER